MDSTRAWRQFLQTVSSSGITHVPSVQLPKPVTVKPTRTKKSSSHAAGPRAGKTVLRSPIELERDQAKEPVKQDATAEILNGPADTPQQKADLLCQLSEVVAGCQRCTELAGTRTQTVFGVGSADARIMFVGEAPGADEDRMGEPFVGRAGQLLDRIIEACQLRREDLYICNILRCRPPGNRNPLPQEAANCREYLDAQIQLVKPEYIVCWGTVAAQNLLGEKRTIGRLRGVFHSHHTAKVLCTYHPSYLLRNPSAKKDVWDDMKILMKDLGIEPS